MLLKKLFFILIAIAILPGITLPAAARNKPLKIVYCDYRPFYFIGAQGKPRGILVDFWNLWSHKTKVPVEFIKVSSWQETMTQVENGTSDINAAIFRTPKRDARFDFSTPFFELTAHVFYNLRVEPPGELKGLDHLRLGLVDNDYSAQFIKEKGVKSDLVFFQDYESLVKAGISNTVDAFIMILPVATTYLAKHNGLKTVHKTSPPIYVNRFMGGVKEGREDLLKLVNRGISAISDKEINAILENWTGRPHGNKNTTGLSQVSVVVSDDHMPFYYFDNQGKARGMLIDLWKLWSGKTGIDVDFKRSSFSGSLEMVKTGRADIHGGCFYSETRDAYLDYATFLTNCHTHFFFHESIYGVKTLEDLTGFKIGVMEKDFAIEFVKNKLPGAVLQEYPSNPKLFDAVKRGEVRVFVGDTPTALSYLSTMGILHEWRHHAGRPIYAKAFYGAVKEGDTELFNLVSKGMQAITRQERAAIERNWTGRSALLPRETLKIACPAENYPFTTINPEGKPAGMLVDMWRLWAKVLGKSVEFSGYTRDGAVNAVSNGIEDIHAGLVWEPARFPSLDLSQPFYSVGIHLFHHKKPSEAFEKAEPYHDLDLDIGFLGAADLKESIKKRFPMATPVAFDTESDMIRAAADRTIDAFVASPHSVLPILGNLGLMDRFSYDQQPLFQEKLSFAVAKGNRDLLKLAESGLEVIDGKKLAEIEGWWIKDQGLQYFKPRSTRISLTTAEKLWIKENSPIRIGVDPAWLPFESMDKNGNYMGMVSEYVKTLEKRLGLSMEIVPGIPWSKVLEDCRGEDKNVDVIPCIVPTEERNSHFLFTRSYLNYPWVVITRNRAPLMGSIRDIHGKTAAVVKDYAVLHWLEKHHKEIGIVLVDTAEQGLKKVSAGQVDAYIGNLAAASFQIRQNSFSNLKVAASTPFGEDGLAFGVRKDWPILVGILNKGLDSFTPQEHDAIREKWFSVRFDHTLDRRFITKMVIYAALAALLLLGTMFMWNRQIRLREERFRGLIEHGTDIIQAIAGDGTITYQSPSNTSILGYDKGELVGRSIFDILHPEEWTLFKTLLKTFEESVAPETRVHRYRHKTDGFLFFETHCINLLHNRTLKAIVLTARDLTKHIDAEKALYRAKEAAESANNAKSEFLANLSHEIRTPLNAFMGMTEITLRGRLAPGQRNNLNTARESGFHLTKIIDDLLDISRIEAGKMAIDSCNFNLFSLLDQLGEIYGVAAKEKGLRFRVKRGNDLPTSVKGDPVRLRQVLTNLLDNAVKFTGQGSIELLAHMVEGPPKDRFVMKFVVKDTGRGIPEESTDEVFDTFTQAGVPLDQLRSGTGLGLAICRQLVDLMGGTIHVDTTLGKGSAFIFTILLNRPDTGALPPCPEPLRERTPHPSITVLVAEDNPPNAAVTVHFLKEMGHRTLLATNGVEVLDLLTRHRVDLVLMDFRMPRMDGLEASRRIRQGIPGEKIPGEKMRNLPIIAMTAHAVASYRDKFMAIGINGFLIKPVGFDELWQAIDTTVFNQSAPPPSPRNETAPLFDIDKALYLMGGNQALAREVCSIFLDDTPGVVEKLNAAIGQENRENAYIAAHTLKGACARVGALACQELSEGLIDGIHGMPLENLEKKTDRINKIFKRTCSSIGQWIETPETPREKECPIEQNC